jgi:hypothetical protein
VRAALAALAVLLGAVLAGTIARAQADDGSPGDGPVHFETGVLPVLEARCFSCNAEMYQGRAKRPKGKLALDRKEGILRKVVVPGSPEKSALLTRISLPADHEDAMPPDGERLSAGDVARIRAWIAAGAPFGTWTGAGAKHDAAAAPGAGPGDAPSRAPEPAGPGRFAVFEALGDGLAAAPGTAVRALEEAGARVEPVFPGSPLLRVSFVAEPEKGTDDVLAKTLVALRGHVAILDLRETAVTDRALGEVGKIARLVRLDLARTAVTDKGVAALVKSKPAQLRQLNLYGTAVTDAALDALAGVTALEAVHLWDSKATDAGAARLRAALPHCRVELARALPAPDRRSDDDDEEGGGGRPRRRAK